MHRWKFDNDRGAWRAFQPGLQTIQARLGKLRFDRIGWIESGRAGWQKRAYQPCADPARFLAQALGLPCGGDLCKRSGGRQSSRNFGDRFLALRGTLDCKGRQLQDCRRYLLLEDVFTTGATANAAAAALKKNGVLTVTILSLLLREEAFD
ncbi:MAG: hypothetical protein K1X75_03140 [Leptospirales bacterium]|nr:hypothetical protein [Leptospirales bacterium]